MRTQLSIVLVNYNTQHFLVKCLESIKKNVNIEGLEIIVVDNASSDKSVQLVKKNFPHVRLIIAETNLGFAKANNIGVGKSKGEFVLLLNPDTEINPGAVEYVLGRMKSDDKVGIATCKVLLANGKIDPASHRGFPTPWVSLFYFIKLDQIFPKSHLFGRYHLTFEDLDKPHEIDSPSGAFFMIRRLTIDQIGFLDEDYFMYAEDIDWAFRAKKAGWRVMYYPEFSITHYKGISSGIKSHTHNVAKADEVSRKRAIESFYDTMNIFYDKHFAHLYPAPVGWLVKFAVFLKKRIALGRKSV